ELGRRAIGAKLRALQRTTGDQPAISPQHIDAVEPVDPHGPAARATVGLALADTEHLQLLRELPPFARALQAVDAGLAGELTGNLEMRPAAHEAGAGRELNLRLRIVG